MGKVKYHTEEERIAARRETNRRSYYKHKEKRTEYQKKYQQEHKEERAEYQKQYNKTPMGRALNLLKNYQKEDKKYSRGECTLTAQWIVDNIFTKKCAHCEKTGWEIIGCNRINNSLPHTPDNVEPCCEECNKKLPGRSKKALRAKETVL